MRQEKNQDWSYFDLKTHCNKTASKNEFLAMLWNEIVSSSTRSMESKGFMGSMESMGSMGYNRVHGVYFAVSSLVFLKLEIKSINCNKCEFRR